MTRGHERRCPLPTYQWELTNDELDLVPPGDPLLVAEAQIKKLIEWGAGLCPHGTQAADTSAASRRECGRCWRQLRREVGLE